MVLLLVVGGAALIWLSLREAREVPAVVSTLADAGALVIRPPPAQLEASGVTLHSVSIAPTSGKACLRGTVVDAARGTPVAAATLDFDSLGGRIHAQTDERGAFEVQTASEERLSLRAVSASGYEPFRPESATFELQLRPGVCASGVSFALQRVAAFRVVVTRADGTPIEGARVERGSGAFALTQDDGVARLEAPEGEVLQVTRSGFLPEVLRLDFRVGVTRGVHVILRPQAIDGGPLQVVLKGLVVDETDAGVDGALVRVIREGDPVEWVEPSAVTDAGRFQFEVMGPGPWRLEAREGARRRAFAKTQGEEVVLRLGGTAVLSGVVRSSAGPFVTSFAVLLSRSLGSMQREPLEDHYIVSADGTFRIAGLPPGEVEMVVAAPSFAPSAALKRALKVDQTERVEVVLEAGATLTGKVVERGTGTPLEAARVSLEQGDQTSIPVLPVARTDQAGTFELRGLPKGRHSLLFVAPGHDARLVSIDAPTSGPVGPLTVDLAAVPDGGSPQLELVGIGAVLKAIADGMRIETVVEGGGAAEVGLKPFDLIVTIDQVPAAQLGFAGSVERIRGPQDSTVLLEVRRAGGHLERVSVPRRKVTR
jgi:hypothetical protein